MATAQSPMARQPEQLDYASPTQFRFGINQLPKVEFFTVAANLPGISAGTVTQATPFKDIPLMGEKMEYENLSISFIVDEYLENYISLHNWMVGIGFPENREQFRTFRDVTSKTPAGGGTPTVDRIGKDKHISPLVYRSMSNINEFFGQTKPLRLNFSLD